MSSDPLAAQHPDGPVVEARGLSIFIRQRAGELRVVQDLSFTIGRGEILALVGESGSGKTMIARAMMRLLPPRKMRLAGHLAIGGDDVVTAPERLMRRLRGQRVSMIFQEPMTSLNPIMTVEQQIGEAMRAHGRHPRQERRERIEQLLRDTQFVRPGEIMRMYPHELSGGMRQRVMIAMALLNRPDLLIADEPTTALDATVQHEVMQILLGLRDRYALSILLISHDLGLIQNYADKVAVLYGGVLMEHGPARQVIDAPRHPYTSALLACAPRPREGGARQVGIEGNVPQISEWSAGCRFAPRCAHRRGACVQQPTIPLRVLRDDRTARCVDALG